MSAQPGWLPTPLQERLLGACLLEECAARAAWSTWRASVDLEQLDLGSYRLLPLLGKRLAALGADDPARKLIKRTYHRTWYQNQMLFARAGELVAALTAAGIPVMLLKGAALALLYYRDAGARPMNDLDLAVPHTDARRAVELLFAAGWRAGLTPLKGGAAAGAPAQAGWTLRPRPPAGFTPVYFGVRHAHGFTTPDGLEADLHWHIFQERCDRGDDDDLWAAAVPAPLRGAAVLALSPADQLLHLLAHAARWNPVSPVRWVADAAVVVRDANPPVDWERFSAGAHQRRFTLPAGELLGYLAERFGVPVPPEVTAALRRAPVNHRERRAHRVRVSIPGFATGLEELRYLVGRHRALRRDPAVREAVPAFPAFVREVLGAERLLQVGLYAALETMRRVGGRRRPTSG